MPTAKRKATASPAASDDDGALEIGQPLDAQSAQAHASSSLQTLDGDLRQLDLSTLETYLPGQKRRVLETLVGCLPSIPTAITEPVAPTSALTTEDEDAAVFHDSRSKDADTDARLRASSCVGLEEEWHNLHGMLHATVTKQESNSCLLIGAAGAGKSLLVGSVLDSIDASEGGEEKAYYHVHLAGTIQINDRSAMKEMAQQLILQGAFTEEDVGEAIDAEAVEDEESDGPVTRPAGDHVFGGDADDSDSDETATLTAAADEAAEMDELAGAILSSLNNIIAHIIALLSTTSSSAARKPLIITLDEFDLFTARPRQAMLYCLLDAVQAASYGAGLAVVGLTSRVDTVDLLEKRVKSRFSHRILHVRPAGSFEVFERIVRNALAPVAIPSEGQGFTEAWTKDISSLFAHPHFRDVLRGVYELTNDVRTIYRILTPTIARLSVLDPTFDLPHLLAITSTEVSDGLTHVLRDLTEPEMALLISIKHLQTRDRPVFNFEMCFDELRRFAARDARERQAASTAGSAVTTPFFADRKIALMAFHALLNLEVLLPENVVASLAMANPVAKPSAAPFASQTGRANQNTIRKEFWKVRCVLSPFAIVAAVKDRQRQVGISSSLVKWASSHG
ncbi:P-loop containing nucleoside triphosphate hydrolase [Kalmanozyma brasiliensis GHG001]|uniref:Uncharacterized protein n=1 Tax=Kalmanozyma brasiliensis (strain GHG001) TaxID=1365824 RepID=V5EWH8_KALBG|nr:P-loop containing nucleoside triphosphate hydrolase [Kalmanozyma brasiliensis GHG001]EST06659.1 P-loop containing nucleoside triphosphate hydrolase [Kalmanozyma brasiliensis GHG001]